MRYLWLIILLASFNWAGTHKIKFVALRDAITRPTCDHVAIKHEGTDEVLVVTTLSELMGRIRESDSFIVKQVKAIIAESGLNSASLLKPVLELETFHED